MEDVNGFYPISCENCRNKKSKCDRELPICSQCSSSGVTCRYPPINKRGIPSGYLSYIEQRLLETELVVFELLSAIYKAQAPIQPHRMSEQERQVLAETSQKQPKSAKIEEWKSQPLATDEHRHAWWLRKCELISVPTQFSSNNPPQDAITPQDTWADSPLSVQFEDMQSHIVLQSPISGIPQALASVDSWPSPPTARLPSMGVSSHINAASSASSGSIAGQGQGAVHASSFASSITDISGDSQPLSAERWRKYF